MKPQIPGLIMDNKADKAPSTDSRINISEIFASIQGEGRYLGTPAIFIRTSGCNLRCKWNSTLCDSPYTSWEAQTSIWSVPEVVNQVQKLRETYNCIEKVIITGGEPVLQKNIDLLFEELKKLGIRLSLETNGTIAKSLKVDFVSISPKLRSSVPSQTRYEQIHEKKRYNKEALFFWTNNYPYQLKFVVNDDDDEHEISKIITDLNLSNTQNIYVMPQGITKRELEQNSTRCIDISIRRGWNYTPRAHIEIFGNARGR